MLTLQSVINIHKPGLYQIRCRLPVAVFQPISEARLVNVICVIDIHRPSLERSRVLKSFNNRQPVWLWQLEFIQKTYNIYKYKEFTVAHFLNLKHTYTKQIIIIFSVLEELFIYFIYIYKKVYI